MNIKDIFKLSVKYLLRYKRRFSFLFSALTFGFCIVTVIVSLKDGMSDAVYSSAQGHYAGDIVFGGYDVDFGLKRHLDKDAVDKINTALETARHKKEIDPVNIVYRTMLHAFNLYYNGDALELKYLIGVDWENEKDYFDGLNYSGAGRANCDLRSIIISEPVAGRLGIKIGDSVLIELQDRFKQKNTAVLIVAAIVKDSSIFGYYKAFMDRSVLNQLIGFEQGECSLVGVYVKNKNTTEHSREVLQKELEDKIQLTPLVYTRDQWDKAEDVNNGKLITAILTLKVYISEISQILDAVNLLAAFLYVMMLLIILVSAGVTYRLILHERTKEIGTMRAMGAGESSVRAMLVIEALLLASAALVSGFILARLAAWGVSLISFSWMPSFEIFLKQGRLEAAYKITAILKNIAAVYIVVFVAVFFPVYKASVTPLPQILSGSVKE
ncbi:MAG: hypothetical protein Ta2F_01910 [Termitinemataceae bacterium]|nr:MAG: hypothetical protein Ta2F_01910 [Termitinemataceae bacterium]